MSVDDQRGVAGAARDLHGYGRSGPVVRWPDGARVAVSFVLNWEEGSEPSYAAGDAENAAGLSEAPATLPAGVRDLAVESVYEYGARAGIWRLQRLFDAEDIPLTLFTTAAALELHPQVAAWVRERGHEPAGHGYRWVKMWQLDLDAERAQIRDSVASIERTTGTRPYGWYSRYTPSERTRSMLVDEGFLYDSDAYNDDLPYFTRVDGRRHLVVPYSLTYNDGRYTTPWGHPDPTSFFDQCRRGFDQLWAEGETHPKMLSIGFHPRLIGQAARTHALAELIAHMRARGGVWFTRRLDIANWWLAHHDEF
jgi:peptidoglycan/xylan/chitin deacetylase (PgdA/CDA1 family)